jgi:hypothetical protein
MTRYEAAKALLLALTEMSQANEKIGIISLSTRAGVEPAKVRGLLPELERAGWVDAAALRLTLAGLAVAIGLQRGEMRRSRRRKATREVTQLRDLDCRNTKLKSRSMTVLRPSAAA